MSSEGFASCENFGASTFRCAEAHLTSFSGVLLARRRGHQGEGPGKPAEPAVFNRASRRDEVCFAFWLVESAGASDPFVQVATIKRVFPGQQVQEVSLGRNGVAQEQLRSPRKMGAAWGLQLSRVDPVRASPGIRYKLSFLRLFC